MNKVEKLKQLNETLNQYRDSYYNDSKSEISDALYDVLYDELVELEKETGIIMSNSPTQTVGYEVKSKLEKVRHSHPMLSLDKTKLASDLVEFANDKDCLLMHKLDGLTILLTYENGELIQAETRGDGEQGELITHNAKAFTNVPLKIDFKERLEIEGEAIITYDNFERINSRLPEDKKYKNPRNLVSGSVRQLDSEIAASRNIKFIAWKVPIGIDTNSMCERLMIVRFMGFDVVNYWAYANKSSDRENIHNMIQNLKCRAKENGIPIDGLVMSYNDIEYGKFLGTTGHHPRHSIAYKFYDEESASTIKEIEWSMGKTGDLTPVAIFDDVEIEGTTVSRASLHNVSILKDLQIGIGDEVTVYKANQIIPQIRDNHTRSDNVIIPDTCPVCDGFTIIVKDNDTEVLKCNNPECKGKLLGRLTHFCSKNAINIKEMSESTIEFLINKGWVTRFDDLYHLDIYADEWTKCAGFGKKSVYKLLDNIEKSKNTTLDRFIYSLSIPLIGKTASKAIFKHVNGDITDFYDKLINGYNWTALGDFGATMNESINSFGRHNCLWIKELATNFIFEIPKQNAQNYGMNILEGKTFVITGSVNHFKNRDELKDRIENLGGKVSGSVSAKTDYLINNEKTSNSSKNKKSKELSIPIITEEEFLSMINN
ncbi:NAD-dependent DNA ligase LigA [Konateibacter massiliensis]|uniref:NAD-dependent DNA ligase LigA n=1 Tax=Konateibacter massiliensis TaxID=2002841 RepID=UPI000C14BB77|nr:NAD-dependent DNA ligase LigA [Konateibacter massiliensis]